MEKYNYKKALTQDIINYIKDYDVLDYEYEDIHDLHETLNNELWGTDIVGNDGCFYNTEEKCEEYLAGNFELAYQCAKDLGVDFNYIPVKTNQIAQYFDCMIRCNLLWECIELALRELGAWEEINNDD